MTLEGESLGKSRLDLAVDLSQFRRDMKEGKQLAGGMDNSLEALAAVAEIAKEALGDVKMSGLAAAESNRIADRIEGSVGRVGRAAMEASHHLEQVKLDSVNAAETAAAGGEIEHELNQINKKAKEAKRSLIAVRLGYGVGPFGAGYGRLGAVGTLIGAGALAAPAAAPGFAGLLAGIPTLAAGAAGAIGTLVLAFKGMGKAIDGDLKAYKALQPEQQKFVQTIRSMIPWVDQLKRVAGQNLFGGVTEGLRSAFSPTTVQAITKAVAQFAAVMGQAAAAWGRFFGSPEFAKIFGPLMESGARNLSVLSDTALHLFDALGVLGRAAIPLTNWLVSAADYGSRLADAWVRAADGSGRLASAMRDAQSSLRLVGGLLVAAGRAVAALGQALYPVSQVFLVDLTNGLNGLAGVIRRNEGAIQTIAGTLLVGFGTAIKIVALGIEKFNEGLEIFVGQKANVVTAIIAIGAALLLAMGPQAAAITGAIFAIGLIAQHWQQITTFMPAAMSAAWTGVKGLVNLGVYGMLLEIDLIAKGVAKAFGWVPIIGPKIKQAFGAVDGWIEGFRTRGVAELRNAGAQMGAAWGNAFAAQTLSSLKAVSGAFDEWAHGHRKKALNSLAAQGFTTDLLTGKKIPAAPQSAVPGIDWSSLLKGSTTTADVFGTPPPFDKNLGPAKRKKQPPLLPPGAQHALDLASANQNKADNLGDVGKAAERYLSIQIGDLQTAANLIREKYGRTAGKVHTQLFHALTGVMNKIRDARVKLREAIYQDKLSALAFAINLQDLAMASAKEGSDAYKRAAHAEEKLLRSEIAYLDKRVRNKKLSMALRSDALQAEIAARQQLNGLLGTTASTGGAIQADFLSSFQNIVHAYAPNAFPEPPTTKPLETKGYEQVSELRGIRRILERIEERDEFPASGYATASAEAAMG